MEVAVKTKSPVVKVDVAGNAGINEAARTTEKKAIVWMSKPIEASGMTHKMIKETCQHVVSHWKNHSLQHWLSDDGNGAYLVARKIGGIEEGFCTAHSDCVSTLYSGTNPYRGKMYRCVKPKGRNVGKCRLRSTGRYVGWDNTWCGERCERGSDLGFLGRVGGSGEPSCDSRYFECRKTVVPWDGWYWAWQDPKKLTQTVYQCVPKNRENSEMKFGGRRMCARQPGIYGD